MTCIVGLVEGNKTYMGGDSLVNNGTFCYNVKEEKVFKAGKFLFGETGRVSTGNILRYKLKIPRKPADMNLNKFVCTKLKDAIRTTLLDNGNLRESEGMESMKSEFMIAYKDHIFVMGADLSIEEVGKGNEGYYAIGSGREYAIGSICTTKDLVMDAESRVLIALEASAKHCPYVEAPFFIAHT